MKHKIGLVLGGGGAKGAFQVGVWKALCEYKLNKKITCISGNSIGSLNSVLFSQKTVEECVDIWSSLDMSIALSSRSIKDIITKRGIFSRDGLKKLINEHLDLSNMSYKDFITAYSEIIEISSRKLKQNSFAVFVVGDIRDSKGAYRDFVSETKRIFTGCGLSLYNDIVLLEQIATKAMIAAKQFTAKRKVSKTHQNVLVFYKGSLKEIKRFNPDDIVKVDLKNR